MPARRRSAARARRAADDGVSMVEVLVTLAVLGIVMSIFTAGVLQAYRVTNAALSASGAQTQLHLAFQRLDKEIRYASWINQPGVAAGAWYVEFAVAGGCRQLRLDGAGTLQMLRWTPGMPPAAGSAGQTVAAELVYDAATGADRATFVRQKPNETPFATSSAGPTGIAASFRPDFYRLLVRLTARGAGATRLEHTFTAVNTARATLATNRCSEGRP